ncbi:hypothetical protein [Qipengyuania flava]|uniref:hypothetical protein n=1 Tax=Qipengyuania flava TaxID=192812 RepID=UPI001C57A878|nr:hypothetical protein [Qipengyuania flava]MBW3168838.1 hypothetical protein [Qipengyuania flava]MBY5966076.1 hypothetical protein [Qipengyuania flava]MBY6012400.1 hypothetical protein [Qipengyuania flava]MBY6026842.1 hypothetical protein [Qipengyuania flava]
MKTPLKDLNNLQLLGRLQAMLANAARGNRSIGDDRQYPQMRRILQSRGAKLPSILEAHPSIDSVTAYLERYADRPTRAAVIRQDFNSALEAAETEEPQTFDPSSWNGSQSASTQLAAVKALIPLAQASIEGLIASLGEPGANGGPILDERAEAIEHLRQLHTALGELLTAAESGHLNDELGEGLAAEAARYAKRAARSLRDDPMPYVASSLLLAVLTACGLPGIGGYLSGVALNIRKRN